MKEVFIIYKTDDQHSNSSKELICVATDFESALIFSEIQSLNEGHRLDRDQIFNLKTIKQTQGYLGEGEFVIEKVKTNMLF